MSDEPRFSALLGMEVLRLSDGSFRTRLTVSERHLNGNNVVHGAVLSALLDSVMGIECWRLGGKAPVATAELSVRYLAPVHAGSLEATARVRKVGSRLVVAEGELHCDGELVALAQGTFAKVHTGPRTGPTSAE